jgi:hypothetical protein
MLVSLNRSPTRSLVALLLAILFAQAVPSQPISLDRGRGPVFSAATAEVTLPPREEEAGLVCSVSLPCPDDGAFAASALVSEVVIRDDMQSQVWPDNRQRGPPPRPPSRSTPAPREPPHLI